MHDCHTAGYAPSAGEIAERDWLMGDGLGHKGQWGTACPGNLRNDLNGLSERQWLEVAKTARYRPPMPRFTWHQMADDDLRAICRFVKHLGPAGSPVPAYVPPRQEPAGPHVTYPGLPNERSTLHDGDRVSRRRLARTGWVLPLTLEAPVI